MNMNFENKNYLDYKKQMDHTLMTEYINEFSERYSFMSVTSLGESILGKNIPIISLGNGERSVMYVGAHHGTDWITTIVLLRFINEFCELYKSKRSVFSIDMEYLFATRTINVVPMLNPDGVGYQINGIDENNPLYERVIKMNGNSSDLSGWRANARGVDLDHNYNCGFSDQKRLELEADINSGAPNGFSGNMPESEPEVALICNYLRFNDNIKSVISLQTSGKEIFCGGEHIEERTKKLGAYLSRITGYKFFSQLNVGARGRLCDWCNSVLYRPSFTVLCGNGTTPLPISDNFAIYTDIRQMLFLFPVMIN